MENKLHSGEWSFTPQEIYKSIQYMKVYEKVWDTKECGEEAARCGNNSSGKH